jgi:ATP-dependent protease ClpP protease subunit
VKVINISGIIASEGDLLPDEEAKKTYSLAQLQAELAAAGNEPVTAIVNTPGGNVDEGIAIYEELKKHGVDTIGKEISSIGSIIMLGGKKETRKVYKDGFGMIHQAWLDPEYLQGIQLNADVLAELTTEAEANNKKLLDIYTAELGQDKEKELIDVMAESTILGADRLIELGFASEVIEDVPQEKAARRAYNYSRVYMNLIKTNMTTKEQTEKIGKLEAALAAFKAFFTKGAKALNITATDASGKAVEMFIATEDEIIVSKIAYLVEGGAPTDQLVPAGTYKLDSGKEITVDASGVITEEKEAPAAPEGDTMESLQAKLTAAMAENEALKAANTTALATAAAEKTALEEEKKTKEAAALAQYNALRTELDEFKNKMAGATEEKNVDDVEIPVLGRRFAARKVAAKKDLSPAELVQARFK